MNKNTDPKRNLGAEKERSDDPQLRDEDGRQPGANTISKSANDEANEHLTKTASDNFNEEENDKRADKRFDE